MGSRVATLFQSESPAAVSKQETRHSEWMKQKINLARANALPANELKVFAERGGEGFKDWLTKQSP